MNILFYYGRPLKSHDGGIANITLSLINRFSETGHNTYVLSKKGEIDRTCLENQFVLPYSVTDSVDNINFIEDFIKTKGVEIIINQIPIDDESFALWKEVVGKTGIKMISCFHNPITLSAKNIAYRKEYALKKRNLSFLYPVLNNKIISYLILKSYIVKNRKRYRDIFHNSDCLVVLCEGMRQELEEMLGLQDEGSQRKVKVIPNFLNHEHVFHSKKEKLIIWCGHVDFDVKRVDVVLDFWERFSKTFPDWKLSILGDGPNLNEAYELCNNKGLEGVSFEGRVDPKKYYCKASFTIVTSAYESFSLVTLESMSYGCVPVVFNTFPAASFIIDTDKAGLLIQPYDIQEAIKKMATLLDDNDTYNNYSRSAYNRSLSFDVSEIEKLWQGVLH